MADSSFLRWIDEDQNGRSDSGAQSVGGGEHYRGTGQQTDANSIGPLAIQDVKWEIVKSFVWRLTSLDRISWSFTEWRRKGDRICRWVDWFGLVPCSLSFSRYWNSFHKANCSLRGNVWATQSLAKCRLVTTTHILHEIFPKPMTIANIITTVFLPK